MPLKQAIIALNEAAENALEWQINSQTVIKQLLLLNAEERELGVVETKLPLLNKYLSDMWYSSCFFKKMTALEYLNQRFTTNIRERIE